MHITLIHPPVFLNVHAMTALRPALPLGLAYVANEAPQARRVLQRALEFIERSPSVEVMDSQLEVL